MDNSILDVAVIGAGHAGLSASYYLNRYQLRHIVFERSKIGDSWRSQRWDTFKMNTANKANLLPGMENILPKPEEFSSALEFVASLELFAQKNELPVLQSCNVLAVKKTPDSKYFSISVSQNGAIRKYHTKQVVIASGSQNKPLIPSSVKNISPDIIQLHAGAYKNASLLPEGAVLVVGSAQSGAQITEDLLNAGKKVFLSTSKIGRIPRRYRGRDIVDWLGESKEHRPSDTILR